MDWEKIVELIKSELIKVFRISYFHLNGSEGGFLKEDDFVKRIFNKI